MSDDGENFQISQCFTTFFGSRAIRLFYIASVCDRLQSVIRSNVLAICLGSNSCVKLNKLCPTTHNDWFNVTTLVQFAPVGILYSIYLSLCCACEKVHARASPGNPRVEIRSNFDYWRFFGSSVIVNIPKQFPRKSVKIRFKTNIPLFGKSSFKCVPGNQPKSQANIRTFIPNNLCHSPEDSVNYHSTDRLHECVGHDAGL